jgi:hypothetical protein
VAYDIIADVHGQADKLEALLKLLGYQVRGGAWRHPDRKAVFVGDFIDRGPAQVRAVDIARAMVDAGAALAVMGNHELNAIAWHTPDARRPGAYLRPRDGELGQKNRHQHAAFLREVEHDPALHADIVGWFLTLPLWLELEGALIVHACWHPRFIRWLQPRLHRERYLTPELLVEATIEPEDKATKDDATPSVFKAVEYLAKGLEVPLPPGHQFLDKDGHVRTRVRVRWWDETATTYRRAAMLSDDLRQQLPDDPLPAHAVLEPAPVPVFFGHYWLTGQPVLQSSRHACVDYSAGIGGPLVAYRFDGEPELSAEHLVWVD